MKINAFGEEKDIMDWLEDQRVHPEVNRDVLVKRHKRGWIAEEAITTPVIKGAKKNDTKVRVKARNDKMSHRASMFMSAQRVRRKFNMGVELPDLMEQFGLTKNMIEKITTKNTYYNIHWETGVPDHFKEVVDEISQNTARL